MLIFLYGATIALSAFLLFLVQPMIAKVILPWFGGSAAVWTTALMFFQLTLLAGYVYSHATTRYLNARKQVALHVFLLLISLLLLPVIPSPAWRSGSSGDPTLRIVLLLAATVGLPYFMLSTTGPLLQHWFAVDRMKAIPYRLFAVSNAGSMFGLLIFPFALEPFLTARRQAITWSIVYCAFVLLCGLVALRSALRNQPEPTAWSEDAGGPPSAGMQLLWVGLAACASAFLLAITNYLTQNVAPIPFLWVLTLAIYLLSFILCFQSERIYRRGIFIKLLAVALGSMSYSIYDNFGNLEIKVGVVIFGISLFICCMVCHGELAHLKPHPMYLTRFYLMLALGGAIGGLFVAVAAPHIFNTNLELPICIVSCAVLATVVAWREIQPMIRIAYAICGVALTIYVAFNQYMQHHKYIATVRNFYGVLGVTDELESDEHTPARKLVNGTIIHGEQLSNPSLKRQPTSYYVAESGVGRAILLLQQQQSSIRVGVIGLGAGVIAAYCRAGDFYQFYEINPLDVAVANRYFTFLKDCPGKCAVAQGDARLTLERQKPQQFDLLAVDAFSSDAIPIHLLTREAFAQYFRHLRPGGILAVHVTNRYLDLVPVVARAGEEFGRPAFEVSDESNAADYSAESDWMLIGPDTHLFVLLGFHGAPIIRRGAPKNLRTWTDDFSNLYQILK